MAKISKQNIRNGIEKIGIRVSEHAELAIIQARLLKKTNHFMSRFPVDGKRASRLETKNFFDEARQLSTEVNILSDYLTSDLAKKDYGYSFDFSMPTYEAYEEQAHALAEQLGSRPQGMLSDKLLTLAFHKEVHGESLLHNSSEDPLTKSGAAKWLSKFLAAIGIGDVWKVVIEILEENWPTMLERLGVLIAEKNWKGVAIRVESLLDILCSKPFAKALSEKIGEKEAAKVIGKIAAKSVPTLGWSLLILSFVWAVAEEYV